MLILLKFPHPRLLKHSGNNSLSVIKHIDPGVSSEDVLSAVLCKIVNVKSGESEQPPGRPDLFDLMGSFCLEK